MLFEGCYSSGFKPNPKKDEVSFFTSASNGNLLNNGFWKFDNEEKEKAFSSPVFGIFPEEEKEKVQPWNVPLTLQAEVLSLDELASAHLQNHKVSTRITSSAQPLFSDEAAPEFASHNKVQAKKAEDDLERMDDFDVEAKNSCLDTVVIGVKELSLQEKGPSSFGRILCRKDGSFRKNQGFSDVELRCPPQIKPFNFTTPSPDDIVRNSQKLRK